MAAGLGTRLKPLTDLTPKCLVPINGKPLIDFWNDLFQKHNIDQVLINTHYLSDQVEDYLKKYSNFTCVYEDQLLGSAGTLFQNRNFITSEEPFFICYADNLTNTNLSKMLEFHVQKQALLTMRLFHASDPSACGIVELDKNNQILHFEEKPAFPKSDLANGGIYVTDYRIFDYMDNSQKDLGKEVLPFLPNTYGYNSNEYLLDIGTMENYLKARRDVEHGLYESCN